MDRELQKLFKFEEADLFSNRSGTLTSKQRMRLEGEAQFLHKVFLIAGLVVFFIAILPSIILLLTKAALLFLLIFSAVWIPIWSFIGIKVMRMGRPKKAALEVKSVEGRINIIKEEHRNQQTGASTTEYELHVGGMTFDDVGSEAADVMMQGETYAIYYLEDPNRVLSAEKI